MLIIIFFVYFLLIFVILINDTNYCHILQEYFLTIKFYQKGKKKKNDTVIALTLQGRA